MQPSPLLPPPVQPKQRSIRQFLLATGGLWVLGMLGLLASLLVTLPLLRTQLAQQVPNTPPLAILAIAQVIQGGILLLIMVGIGNLCAPRVGLRSRLAHALSPGGASLRSVQQRSQAIANLRPEHQRQQRQPEHHQLQLDSVRSHRWLWTVGLGMAVPSLVLLINEAMKPGLPAALQQEMAVSWRSLLAGILYGGITEELMLRWGVMSLVAWLLWKLFDRYADAPRSGVMMMAIAISALLFGAGHLPITSLLTPLTPLVVFRALLLNGLGAIAFGWLFWQFDLEAAMVAHMLFHGFSFVIALSIGLLS